MKELEIFRAGTHIDSSGRAHTYTQQDIEHIAASYNPGRHEAPIVIGHPKHDAPAFGWVDSLKTVGDRLLAVPKQVAPEFAALVDRGAYKKISCKLFEPGSPRNPSPGGWSLCHVGALGAAAPAVSGLKSIEFSAEDSGAVEFGDWDDQLNATLWRGLRDWMIGQYGQDAADKVIPPYSIQALEQMANAPEESGGDEGMGASPSYSQISERESALAAREAAIAAREAELQQQEFAGFAEELIGDGRLLPVEKDDLVAFLASQGGTVEFGQEGQKSSLEVAKDYLRRLPKTVEFSEVAADSGAKAGTVSFAAPPGAVVDQENLEIHGQALAYQAKNPGIPYIQAVKAVGGQ